MLADFEKAKETGDGSGDEKENLEEEEEGGEGDDRTQKEMVGPQAVNSYYKHYKRLKHIIEKNKLNSTPSTNCSLNRFTVHCNFTQK